MDAVLPDECDFCGQQLDADEELEPVFVGDPPEPSPQFLKGISECPDHDRLRNVRLSGRSAGELLALLDALRGADTVKFDTNARVMEVRGLGGASHAVGMPADESFGADVNDDKAGAEVRVDADHDEPEPDLEVCPLCAEAFSE